MVNHVNASQRIKGTLKVIGVHHITLNHGQRRMGGNGPKVVHGTAPEIIQDGHDVPLVQKPLDEGGTNETGTTGDQNTGHHGLTRSTTSSSTPCSVRRNSTTSPVLTVMQGSWLKP